MWGRAAATKEAIRKLNEAKKRPELAKLAAKLFTKIG